MFPVFFRASLNAGVISENDEASENRRHCAAMRGLNERAARGGAVSVYRDV